MKTKTLSTIITSCLLFLLPILSISIDAQESFLNCSKILVLTNFFKRKNPSESNIMFASNSHNKNNLSHENLDYEVKLSFSHPEYINSKLFKATLKDLQNEVQKEFQLENFPLSFSTTSEGKVTITFPQEERFSMANDLMLKRISEIEEKKYNRLPVSSIFKENKKRKTTYNLVFKHYFEKFHYKWDKLFGNIPSSQSLWKDLDIELYVQKNANWEVSTSNIIKHSSYFSYPQKSVIKLVLPQLSLFDVKHLKASLDYFYGLYFLSQILPSHQSKYLDLKFISNEEIISLSFSKKEANFLLHELEIIWGYFYKKNIILIESRPKSLLSAFFASLNEQGELNKNLLLQFDLFTFHELRETFTALNGINDDNYDFTFKTLPKIFKNEISESLRQLKETYSNTLLNHYKKRIDDFNSLDKTKKHELLEELHHDVQDAQKKWIEYPNSSSVEKIIQKMDRRLAFKILKNLY